MRRLQGAMLALVVVLGALAGCTAKEPAARLDAASDDEDASASPDTPIGGGGSGSARPPSSPSTSSPSPSTPATAPPAEAPAPEAPAPPAVAPAPAAVVALVDTGINPYHAAFRDESPRARQHPSTYLAGYPADARPLDITFGHTNLSAALEADCAVWTQVEPGRLYYVPGTRIVGAISLPSEFATSQPLPVVPPRPVDCEGIAKGRVPHVFDASGHGTMTASRAAGAPHGACPSCLVVSVQNFGGAQVAWAAAQPWIDLQSDSWGPLVMAAGPADSKLLLDSPALARTVEAAAQAQLSFWATGNGAAGRFGVAGHPTQASPHFTPSVVRVGGHDNGRVAPWPGTSPHVVSDSCNNWAADAATLHAWSPTAGNGTSSATPFAAGLAARVLLEAREALGDARTGEREGGVLAQGPPRASGPLDDGALTRAELLLALMRTADARPDATAADGVPCEPTNAGTGALYPTTPVEWRSVPDGPAGILFVGYGALTPETAAAARRVLLGAAGMPERPDEDAWFAKDAQAREATHEVYTSLP